MENNNQSFWQFSDQLRVHTNNLDSLSLNDSIWSNSYVSKKPERRNFDIRVGGELNSVNSSNGFKAKDADFNGFNTFDNSLRNPSMKDSNFNGFRSLDNSSNTLKAKESNFDARVGGELNSGFSSNMVKAKNSDFNGFNHGFKLGGSDLNGFNLDWKSPNVDVNSGFSKGFYSKPSIGYNLDNNRNTNNVNLNANNIKGFYKKGGNDNQVHQFNNMNNVNNHHHGAKFGKKNKNKDSNKEGENGKDSNKNNVEKRFKTLPASEALPRDETIGGYIFVCNNDTMQENLQRQLFGLPPRYRDSVRSITPGLPLFLYNYSTHQLHGVYEAASFGGTNIDPTAWEDKKNPGESRFPAQVRVMTRKVCEPLEEDSFRPILHHYDGPKFRLELNIPEALSLLDIFTEN